MHLKFVRNKETYILKQTQIHYPWGCNLVVNWSNAMQMAWILSPTTPHQSCQVHVMDENGGKGSPSFVKAVFLGEQLEIRETKFYQSPMLCL